MVNGEWRTGVPSIWAIADVVRGLMLAHIAEEEGVAVVEREGVAVVERIAGHRGHVDFNTIPNVIYTSPEIAWVGRTEQQLKYAGAAYRSCTFPFMANGRACIGRTAGLVKVIANPTTDEILGVHVVGPQISELVAEAVIAMAFNKASLAVDKRAELLIDQGESAFISLSVAAGSRPAQRNRSQSASQRALRPRLIALCSSTM